MGCIHRKVFLFSTIYAGHSKFVLAASKGAMEDESAFRRMWLGAPEEGFPSQGRQYNTESKETGVWH